MAKNVLIIEDDNDINDIISEVLTKNDFICKKVYSGTEALIYLKDDFDLFVLDLMLPGLAGEKVIEEIRKTSNAPVLVLSSKDSMDSKLALLRGGADDYMTKPFHKDELVARIQAIVRRSKGHAQSVIKTGDITVNLDAKTVEVNGVRVHLTGKEYQMLELLSLRKGTTLTKEMFLNHLYGGMDEPELKIIDVFICKLRKKLAAAADGKHHIETVWGRGYVLRDPNEQPTAQVA